MSAYPSVEELYDSFERRAAEAGADADLRKVLLDAHEANTRRWRIVHLVRITTDPRFEQMSERSVHRRLDYALSKLLTFAEQLHAKHSVTAGHFDLRAAGLIIRTWHKRLGDRA